MTAVCATRTACLLRFATTLALVALALRASPTEAATEEIEASGVFHLGDNDSKLDGHRLALLEAKRNALEQAGTYVESITEVRNFQLTRDEIRSYTAGIIETTEMREPEWTMAGENLAVTVWVRARIDKDDVTRQIAALRNKEEVTRRLQDANAKIRELEGTVADLNGQLRRASGPAVQPLKEARTRALSQIEEQRQSAAALTHGSEGLHHLLSGDVSTATAELREAVRLNPKLWIAHSQLAWALEEKGDRDGAIREWDAACQLGDKTSCYERNKRTSSVFKAVDWVLQVIFFPFTVFYSGASNREADTAEERRVLYEFRATGAVSCDACRRFMRQSRTSELARACLKQCPKEEKNNAQEQW